MPAALGLEEVDALVDRPGVLVGPFADQRVENVRYGDDAIASLSVAHPFGSRVRGSMQLKWTHRGRSTYQGEGVESTGGTIVYAVPGLATSLPGQLSFYVFLPVPVYRYVNETQVAPPTALIMALRIAQSEMASEPSFMDSVSRFGEATEPESK